VSLGDTTAVGFAESTYGAECANLRGACTAAVGPKQPPETPLRLFDLSKRQEQQLRRAREEFGSGGGTCGNHIDSHGTRDDAPVGGVAT
jgi:hypothetical protein